MVRDLVSRGVVGLCVFVVFLGIGFSQVQEAAVPRVIQFNGVLRGSAGQPLAGVQGVTFALYSEQFDGAPLWIESQNVAVDEYGRFAVLLGSATSGGLPVELFSSGQSRWLGVQPQVPGEPEQPRVLLVSVPYALKAADAETLGGLPASAFMLAPGIVTERVKDSGGLASGMARDLDGVTTSAVSDGPPTASAAGDTGYLLRFTDDVGGTGRSALFQDGAGKIGIGTAAPAYALDLPAGEVRFGGYRTWLPYFDAQIRMGNVTPGQGTWAMGISGDVTDDFFFLKMSNGHFPFRIKYTTEDFLLATTAGNVGVGTSSPTQKLDVNGTVKATAFTGNGSALTSLNATNLATGTVANARTTAASTNTANTIVLRDASGNFSAGTVTATSFAGSGSALTGIPVTGGPNTFTGLQTVNGTLNAISTSTVDSTAGVIGSATGASGQTRGVWGLTSSTSDQANGVRGEALGASGVTRGVFGATNSTTNNAAGVFGAANNTGTSVGPPSVGSGQVYGVRGNTNSITDNAAGVRGDATGANGLIAGVHGRIGVTTLSYNNNFCCAAGVRGDAFNSAGGNPNTGIGLVLGVLGNTNSKTNGAAGVQGTAFNDGNGEFSGDGKVFGVRGLTNSIHREAAGVEGIAFGASGETYGVSGETQSTTNGAAGVHGDANGDTGWIFGVAGETNSSTENAAGVAGFSEVTIGVLGVGLSSSGTGGTFANLSGTGKVLSGRSGNDGGFDEEGFPIGPFPEVFRVEGDGDVVANVGEFQALAAGKGIILKSPNGGICSKLSIADTTGALVVTTGVPCP